MFVLDTFVVTSIAVMCLITKIMHVHGIKIIIVFFYYCKSKIDPTHNERNLTQGITNNF